MRMNCAFSCDDAYIQHAGVCTYSIFYNNRDIEEIYIYFIDNNISQIYKDMLNVRLTVSEKSFLWIYLKYQKI